MSKLTCTIDSNDNSVNRLRKATDSEKILSNDDYVYQIDCKVLCIELKHSE